MKKVISLNKAIGSTIEGFVWNSANGHVVVSTNIGIVVFYSYRGWEAGDIETEVLTQDDFDPTLFTDDALVKANVTTQAEMDRIRKAAIEHWRESNEKKQHSEYLRLKAIYESGE